ncbi:MAG: acyltransferase [Telluria sp.]
MKLQDSGKNNKVIFGEIGDNVQLKIYGNNNVVEIDPTSSIQGGDFQLKGNNNRFIIGPGVKIGHLKVIIQDESIINIGSQTTIEQAYFLSRDKRKIEIGQDCMISFQIDLRTSDAHGIYETDGNALINPPGDIILDNHVWLGQGTMISMNVRVASNAVVGARSFLRNLDVASGCIYAGSPARLVRSGVFWTREMHIP